MTVLAGNEGKGSLYDGRAQGRDRGAGWLARPLLLLASLLAAHWLNLFLHWTLIRGELAAKPAFRSPEYTFIGFAPLHGREIAAARRLPNAAPAGRVYAYFDFLHPAVFLVWNNAGSGEFFDLGPVLVSLPAGASRVSFRAGGVLRIEHGGKEARRSFGGSIAGSFLAGKPANGLNGSFVVKSWERSPSLSIPYWIYFALALALVASMAFRARGWMATALFYCSGMFFFFDFERLFFSQPLGWLLRAWHLEPAAPWTRGLAAAAVLLLTMLACRGLLRWRCSQPPAYGGWVVLFFILLPPCLFF